MSQMVEKRKKNYSKTCINICGKCEEYSDNIKKRKKYLKKFKRQKQIEYNWMRMCFFQN